MPIFSLRWTHFYLICPVEINAILPNPITLRLTQLYKLSLTRSTPPYPPLSFSIKLRPANFHFPQVSSNLPISASPKLIDVWMSCHVSVLALVFIAVLGINRTFERNGVAPASAQLHKVTLKVTAKVAAKTIPKVIVKVNDKWLLGDY